MVIVLKVLSSYLTLKSNGCLHASEYRYYFFKTLYCTLIMCCSLCEGELYVLVPREARGTRSPIITCTLLPCMCSGN